MSIAAYVPRSENTRAVYESLLTLVRNLLPPGSDDELVMLTEDVVTVAQDTSLTPAASSAKLARLFEGIGTSLTAENTSMMFTLGQQLSDFVRSRQQLASQGGDSFAMLAEESEDEGDEYDDDDDEGRNRNKNLNRFDGGSGSDDDGASDTSDSGQKIPFEAVSSNADYLSDTMRSLFPMLTPRECEVKAERVLMFLSNPSANELQIQAQLNPLLGGYDDDAVMEWITQASESRWSIVYGLQYARAPNQKAKNAVVEAMLEHGMKDDAVEDVYRHLTGTDIPGKRRGSDLPAASEDSLPLQLLDIEGLSKGHDKSMASKTPKIPSGAKKAVCELHDELILPPTGTYNKTQRLKPIEELPAWTHDAFDTRRMKFLNPMQSIVFPCAFESDANMLVCAPTGAGKTNVALLAMLRCIDTFRDGATGRIDVAEFKMLYIAPMKALVQEVVQTFSTRLEPLGLPVVELSGDSEASKEEILSASLIVATPEKWDVVSRKSMELGIASLIRLCVLDEVHLLHNDRGPVLESIVARMHTAERSTGTGVRIVGLSATLPNYTDVAQFLHVDKTPGKGLFPFDASFRPVPLQQTFCAVRRVPGTNQQGVLNQVTYTKTMEHALDAQVMVFVHSRRDTEFTANFMLRKAEAEADKTVIQRLTRPGSDSAAVVRARLSEVGYLVRESLKELLTKGFAVHHAGLSRTERQLVEELFLGRHLRVLVCTSTLAWGVNLPAHAVIVKGTRVYSPELGRTANISFLDVLQMFGRAGRYGMDISGDACILTTQEDLPHYLGIMTQQVDIESQFLKRFVDVLNAEISLGNVRTVADGVEWLQQTYFYVRMKKNPVLYGAPNPPKKSDPQYKAFLASLIHTACEVLRKHKMIQYDAKERRIQPLEASRIASHFYVSTKSMVTYLDALAPAMHDVQLFRLFAASSEFTNVAVRQEEHGQMLDLLTRVPIAVQEDPRSPLAKINVLLQCYISGLSLDGLPLMSELVYIKDSAQRIFRALHELALRKGYGATAHRLMNLYLMVLRRQWCYVQSPLRQLPVDVMSPKDAEAILRHLEGRREPWSAMLAWTAEDLEAVCKDERRGQMAHRCMRLVPHYVLECSVRPFSPTSVQLDVDIMPDFDFDPKLHGSSRELLLTIEHQNNGRVLYSEYFSLPTMALKKQLVHSIGALVPVAATPRPTHLYVRVVSTSWLGCHYKIPVSLTSLVFPTPPVLSLLRNDITKPRTNDEEQYSIQKLLTPFGVGHLSEMLFPFTDMFPAQFEVCDSVLETNDNLFVGMPPGTGKGFIADLWIIHFLLSAAAEGPDGELCGLLYLTISPAVAARRYAEYSVRYGKHLKQKVVTLSGTDLTRDAAVIETGRIVVCTADQLLPLVRSCHPCLRKFTHIIMDHIHGIRSTDARTYECVISRIVSKPFIVNNPPSADTTKKRKAAAPRVLALSYPLASPAEVCLWLKVPTDRIFNFGDAFRQRDAEVLLEPIDLTSFYARYELARHEAIKLLSDKKSKSDPHGDRSDAWRKGSVLAFVATARDAMECAAMLAQRREIMGTSTPISLAALQALLSDVSDDDLRTLLSAGIGYLHSGTTQVDELLLYDLPGDSSFVTDDGTAVSLVVFASFDASYRIPAGVFESVMVIIPEKVRSGEEREDEAMATRDCTLSELLQMSSRAERRVLVFTRRPRQWLYQTFLRDPLPLESSMRHYSDYSDTINSLVVQGRIKSVADIHKTLQTHFYCVHHMRSNPNFYGAESVEDIGPFLSAFAEAIAKDLAEVGCIELRDDTDEGGGGGGGSIRSLPLGQCAALHCVSCETVRSLSCISLSATPSLLSLLLAVCDTDVRTVDAAMWRRHEQTTFRTLATRVLPLDRFGVDHLSLLFNESKTKILLLVLCVLARCVAPSDYQWTGGPLGLSWVISSVELQQALKPYQQDQLLRDVASVMPAVVHVVAAAVEVSVRTSFVCARRLMHLHQLLKLRMWHSENQLLEIPAVQQMVASTASMEEQSTGDALLRHWANAHGCTTASALLTKLSGAGRIDEEAIAPTSLVRDTVSRAALLADISRRPFIVGPVITRARLEQGHTEMMIFAVDVSFTVRVVMGSLAPGAGAWIACFNSQPGYDKAFALRFISFCEHHQMASTREATTTGGALEEPTDVACRTVLHLPLAELGDGENVVLKACVVFSDSRIDTEVDVTLDAG
jgi:pre-mRNA-splicing helicase BRR2